MKHIGFTLNLSSVLVTCIAACGTPVPSASVHNNQDKAALTLDERVVGIPVDIAALENQLKTFTAITGETVPTQLTFSFVSAPFECNSDAPAGTMCLGTYDSISREVKVALVDAVGRSSLTTLGHTALFHELIHAVYGDQHHKRAELWTNSDCLFNRLYTAAQ